jgi:uncharacterized membrane protein YccC
MQLEKSGMYSIQKLGWVTGLKMALSGALAFYLCKVLSRPDAYWSVVTVAAVTRPGFSNTVGKIILRIVGTLVGAITAYIILFFFLGQSHIIIALYFLVLIVPGYISLQKNIFSYAGVATSLTLTLVIATSIVSGNVFQTMSDRVIEVLIGVLCVSIVTVLLECFFPKKGAEGESLSVKFRQAYSELVQWGNCGSQLKAAILIAGVASLVFAPWLYWQYPGGFWAVISCFFIMEESFVNAQRKGWFRFLSHAVAAAVGGISVILIAGHTVLLAIPLVLGFFVFGYLMAGKSALSASGNTMGIALAVMLLANINAQSGLDVVAARFFNVIGGIAVGLCAVYVVQRRQGRTLP